jgi:hypothetical protein
MRPGVKPTSTLRRRIHREQLAAHLRKTLRLEILDHDAAELRAECGRIARGFDHAVVARQQPEAVAVGRRVPMHRRAVAQGGELLVRERGLVLQRVVDVECCEVEVGAHAGSKTRGAHAISGKDVG